MAVVDGVRLIGQYHVVAINRGTKQGLEVRPCAGHRRTGRSGARQALQRAPQSGAFGRGDNVALPSERAGTLLVFKTYDRMSYGLVVEPLARCASPTHVRRP